VTGRAVVRVGSQDHVVKPGTLLFVPAGVEHRFHSITDDVTLLVLFTPAEGTTASDT
jgi:quercetin dioxygenase-like cupin family protein